MKSTWPLSSGALSRVTIGWPEQYRWHPGIWVDPILYGMRAQGVRIERRPISQPYRRAVVIEVDSGRERFPVVIDYKDTPEVDAAAAADALLYFKMNHLEAGYPQGNVRPGGFVPASSVLYRYLWLLRTIRGRPRFAWDVYGRFGLRYASETRRRAVEILSARRDFEYEGSLYRYEGGPDRVPYRRYLFEITRARVCVDMPNGGDLTWRFIEYLAIGACVVRPRQSLLFPGAVRLHTPLVDGEHIVYCEPDLSDLGDVCARLVRDASERERIGRNARDFFDRHLHRRQLGAYYLQELLRAIESSGR